MNNVPHVDHIPTEQDWPIPTAMRLRSIFITNMVATSFRFPLVPDQVVNLVMALGIRWIQGVGQ